MALRASDGSPLRIHRGPVVVNVRRLPDWARAADYVVLLLVVVALVIAESGGVHVRSADWRLTITSPYRLVAWAAIVALLRHGFARQQPIHRHLAAAIRGWMSSTAFRAAAATFVGTRLVIFLVGFLAVATIGYPPGAPPPEFRNTDSVLANLPLRWDAGWYVQIAHGGYQYSNRIGATGQQSVVFFPAFPIMMRAVALVLGGSKTAYVLAGTLVSLAAFLFGLVYVYRIARRELSEDESRTALWLLAAFPFAYFYGALYTESLFLLGSAASLYHARERQFVRAGIWGLLAGLTRPNGFLLCLPLAVMTLSPWLPRRVTRAVDPAGEHHLRFPREHAAVPALTMAAMPIAGALLFSAFIWQLTGSPAAWVDGHAAWGRHYTGLAVLVTDRYQWIANEGFTGYLSQNPLDFINASAVVFVLATIWPVARRLGLAYAVFIVVTLVPALAEGGMLSAGRLTSVLFPAFIWLASAIPPKHRAGWIAAFAANQALNATLFYTWRPLF
jgi:Mannosyltransferase (PIG-V)